jgi:hypothetical protein
MGVDRTAAVFTAFFGGISKGRREAGLGQKIHSVKNFRCLTGRRSQYMELHTPFLFTPEWTGPKNYYFTVMSL